MPCGRGGVCKGVDEYVRILKEGRWLGYAEVDSEISVVQCAKFKEMCPFFGNKKGRKEAVPAYMKEYLVRTIRLRA